MRLSRKALDAYNAAIKEQGGNAEKAAQRALDVWMEGNPTASIAQTRNFCIRMMDEICTLYGNAAGDAAYALRAIIVDVAKVEPPDVEYEYRPDPEYVDRAARYQVEKLKDGDVDGFKKRIADASRYFAERGGNDTMTALGKADAKKLGSKVRFARVPTGATTCPYCCMLASRGFVYGSELNALNANHRHCDCRIVEGFEGMTVEGYDPDEYYDRWKHPERHNGGVKSNAALRQETKTVKVPKEFENNYDDFIPLDISHETKTQLAQLHELAQENGFEYAQIIHDGKPGDIITSEDPNGVKVGITEADGFGLSLLHSHTNETPLSRKDFRYFCSDQVDYVGNIAINGDIFLASVGNGWRPTTEEYDRIVAQIANEVNFDVMLMPGYANWSPEERTYVAIREQTYRIARHFEWELMGGNLYEQA